MNAPPANSTPAAVPTPAGPAWQRWAGYAFALACLVWVFHDVNLKDLGRHFTHVQAGWVAAAVAFDIASYICQAWRWALLLGPLGGISVVRSTEAIYTGLFLNEVLPLRVGELARIFLVSRWLRAPFVRVVPSIAVERLFDGIWLAASLGLTALWIELPKDLLRAADVLGILMLLLTAVFVYLVFRTNANPAEQAAQPGRLRRMLMHLSAGIREIGISRPVYAAFVLSFFFLFLQAVAFWMVMRAYGLPLSFWQGFVVLLIVHLGTAIPNAPANVGSYQFFVVVGLMLFGVEKTFATGFSVVVFVILTVPLWALGWVALGRTGITFAELRKEIARMGSEEKGEAGP